MAITGYSIISVHILKHFPDRFLFEAQHYRKKLYTDYYTLLCDSIEQFFINTLTLPLQNKTTRYQERFNDLNKQQGIRLSLNSPTSGRISSYFGIRTDPVFEGTAFHKGIDIATVEGTPVYCAADGVVDFCGFKPLLGNVIYIRHHHKNYVTIYGHLRNFNIAKNKVVSRGQLLGCVGSTGKSTGPHLHFEIRYCDIPINPISHLLPSDTLLD